MGRCIIIERLRERNEDAGVEHSFDDEDSEVGHASIEDHATLRARRSQSDDEQMIVLDQPVRSVTIPTSTKVA